MLRIIYYDITENKARTKVSDFLEAEGFDRVQYSVFLGKSDAHHWPRTWERIEILYQKYCQPQDKIFSHVIEQDHFKKMTILGEGPDIEWILQEIKVLFF